ncbi:MAG: hypothetical protein EOP88_10345 [Verrucomicrobiaceae bacterium]|nr:MAG: hypothetical protein EOP88_10345 [Verrucomicrobiaceae bacterium]
MNAEVSNTRWLAPWIPINGGTPDDATAKELYSELCGTHVLHGIKARPLAHRQDCDEFLFELLDGTGCFASVHLTYARHPEPDPRWPNTEIYPGWQEFLHTMTAAADWNA